MTAVFLLGNVFAAEKLRVGMELAYPPFEMKDKRGRPSGVSVEIARDFAKSLGREVEIVDIAWVGLIPALQSGKVDVVVSSMTITKERQKAVSFSDPYVNMPLYLLVNKKSGIQSVADAKKKAYNIAVKSGTTSDLYAMSEYKKSKIIKLDQFGQAAMEVLKGGADFTIYDGLSIYEFWKKNPKQLDFINQSVTGEKTLVGAAFKKGNNELRQQFNAWIKEARKNDFFDTQANKYLKDVKMEFDKRKIPFFFDIR